METALWVSIVAAAASVIAAVVAARSARQANVVADGIDRRQHLLTAHDANVASFTRALHEYLDVLNVSAADSDDEQWASLLGRKGDVLATHPLATDELTSLLDRRVSMPRWSTGGRTLEISIPDSGQAPTPGRTAAREVRLEGRQILRQQADIRAELVETLLKRRRPNNTAKP